MSSLFIAAALRALTLPAVCAPLRRIGESLIVKELLFACRPSELLFAVGAGARLFFIPRTHFFSPFSPSSITWKAVRHSRAKSASVPPGKSRKPARASSLI